MMSKDEQTIWDQPWPVFDRALMTHEDGLREYLNHVYSEDIKHGFEPSYLHSYTLLRVSATPYFVSVESSLEAVLELVEAAVNIDASRCVLRKTKTYIEIPRNYAAEFVNANQDRFERVFIQPIVDADIKAFVWLVRERYGDGMSANEIAKKIWELVTSSDMLLHDALTTKWDD